MASTLSRSARREQDLKQHETIWDAAGPPFAVFRLKPDDLETLTNGPWPDLVEESLPLV